MKTYHDCIPCFMKQALGAARLVTGNPELHEQVLREMAKKISTMDLNQSPPLMGREIHRTVRALTGVDDPYREVKDFYNRFAMDMYDDLKNKVAASVTPLETAVKLAIAGNIIDFGVSGDLDVELVRDTIDNALSEPVLGDINAFAEAVAKAETILYLGDNAGEILFDRILIETLPAGKVVFVTRGGPVINDATLADAQTVGLTSAVRVMDNGTDVPGTALSECSGAFVQAFAKADMIIAKGQGNYETLSDADQAGKIFFLFKVKCPVVARDIGCEMGRAVAASKNSEKVGY